MIGIGKPYLVAWSYKRDLTGFMGAEKVFMEFDDRDAAVSFLKEAKERLKTENPNSFVTSPTFYKRDQDASL